MVNIFFKDNIYGVNFDSGICISMEYIPVKEHMTPTKFLYFKSLLKKKKKQKKNKRE